MKKTHLYFLSLCLLGGIEACSQSSKAETAQNKCSESDTLQKTCLLSLVQGADTIEITKGLTEVDLKSAPFKFIFHARNCDAVFLSCSYDPTSYNQIIAGKKDSLTCFQPSMSVSEGSKNKNLDVTVTGTIDRGYHCLFAKVSNELFISFDELTHLCTNEWIGVRTVNKLFLLPDWENSETIPVGGKSIYVVFSPEIEKAGQALKINFEP